MQALFPLSATQSQRDVNHHTRFANTMRRIREVKCRRRFAKVFTHSKPAEVRDASPIPEPL